MFWAKVAKCPLEPPKGPGAGGECFAPFIELELVSLFLQTDLVKIKIEGRPRPQSYAGDGWA